MIKADSASSNSSRDRLACAKRWRKQILPALEIPERIGPAGINKSRQMAKT